MNQQSKMFDSAEIVELSELSQPVAHEVSQDNSDLSHFVHEHAISYAGRHLIIDLYGGRNLDKIEVVGATLREAVVAAGATLLNLDLHHFAENNGVSGVAVLAESHMSIHTWPEAGYAALDIFVCGDCDPYRVLPILKAAFQPEHIQINELKRGILPTNR